MISATNIKSKYYECTKDFIRSSLVDRVDMNLCQRIKIKIAAQTKEKIDNLFNASRSMRMLVSIKHQILHCQLPKTNRQFCIPMAQQTNKEQLMAARAMSKQISQTFNRLTREIVKYTNVDPKKCEKRLNSILDKMSTYLDSDPILCDKDNWDHQTNAMYTAFVDDAKYSFKNIAFVMSKHAQYQKDSAKRISILIEQCPHMILCNRIFSMKLQCRILHTITGIDFKITTFTVRYIRNV